MSTKRRWPVRIAYGSALVLQAGLLVGAYQLHVLSETKMGVMRYLVAQNAALEASWFAPGAVLAQVGALLVVAIAAAVSGLMLSRRGAWGASAQAAAAAALAAAGAWLASSVSAADVTALYAILLAVWCALLVQLVMTAVSSRRAGRTIEEVR